jgi:amidase
MTDLTSRSATSLARAIREREVSSREVVEAHLQRIEAVNPQLNAVVQLTAERALERACAADDALARGETWGPLHGLPFTVKDWIETSDAICAAGIPERANLVPKHDATAVARLRATGGIMLGKTIDGVNNPVYGPASNPYDLARMPGASSAGEAAIIAAGGSPLGLGSDSGGSIRYPAHCCGVAGLKPSAGRVPLTGHFPRIDYLSDPRTQIGPLARHVEDLALALPIIAGPDSIDASVAPVPLGDWRAVELRALRVATFTEFEGASCTDETASAVREAARSLAAAGASVEEALPARIEESWSITQGHWKRVRSYSWNEWRTASEHALSADEIERHIFEMGRLQRAMLPFMERFDLLLCPVAPGPARLKSEGESALEYVYTLPFSLTGWPCVALRGGTSPEGLPIGVQVVGGPWRDDVALAAANAIEGALGGWQPPPSEMGGEP